MIRFGLMQPPPSPSTLDDESGTWLIRNVPRDLMMRMKILAAREGTSVNGLVLRLAWDYVVQTRHLHGMTMWDIKRMNERGFPPAGRVRQESTPRRTRKKRQATKE
jgi:hypothetical protein